MKLTDAEFKAKAKAIAKEILDSDVEQIGDTGEGGRCFFCGKGCRWDRTHYEIEHEKDCIVNLAAEIISDED